jgi:inosine/xanthosine triphosphate pyrophosphatase family protein
VLDIMETGGAISMSHIAARQEVRDLLRVLNIAQLNDKLQQVELGETMAEKTEQAQTITQEIIQAQEHSVISENSTTSEHELRQAEVA